MAEKPHSWLPATLREIAAVIGNDAAIALAEAEGGRRRYIPVDPVDAPWLQAAIGIEAARRLCAYFATGTELSIPLGPSGYYNAHRRHINQTLDRLEREGFTAGEIARQIGTTERSVYRRRARRRSHNTRPMRGQTELF